MSFARAIDVVWPSLPAHVTESRLYRNGGILILDMPGPEVIDQLREEALLVRADGSRNEWSGSDVIEERGGNPSRAFGSAEAGQVQWNLFSGAAMVKAVTEACGLEVEPSGSGTYSYYERNGDFLALHRDIENCDLTVITCLRDTGPAEARGGLLVYPEHINRPLEAARQARRTAAVAASIGAGQSAALLGGFVPHEVFPMADGQERIVSVMCYRITGWEL